MLVCLADIFTTKEDSHKEFRTKRMSRGLCYEKETNADRMSTRSSEDITITDYYYLGRITDVKSLNELPTSRRSKFGSFVCAVYRLQVDDDE